MRALSGYMLAWSRGATSRAVFASLATRLLLRHIVAFCCVSSVAHQSASIASHE